MRYCERVVRTAYPGWIIFPCRDPFKECDCGINVTNSFVSDYSRECHIIHILRLSWMMREQRSYNLCACHIQCNGRCVVGLTGLRDHTIPVRISSDDVSSCACMINRLDLLQIPSVERDCNRCERIMIIILKEGNTATCRQDSGV